MKVFIDRYLRKILMRGLTDGILAGDGLWLAVGVGAWVLRLLLTKPDPPVVVEQLRQGESIVVTNLGPTPRGRAAKKAARRSAETASTPPQ